MAVLSIRVADDKRKLLKMIASVEGKTLSSIVEGLIGQYIEEHKEKWSNASSHEEFTNMLLLSEKAFSEWDNEDDAIYDHL